jgi:hypothetical protein
MACGMANIGNQGPATAADGGRSRRRWPPKMKGVGLAWALFIAVGLPLGFMAILGPLAYAGIYIEPLRRFWQPWPPDLLKPVVGIAGFAVTLAYLCYRLGRIAGYHSGSIAGIATARNIAEGRIPAPPEIASQTQDTLDMPLPPP